MWWWCTTLTPFNYWKTEGVNQREGTSKKNYQKNQEFIKILTLISLKNSL